MERQLSQMVHLIDDLLDLSRVSRGTIELRRERIELSKVIEQAVEMSHPVVEQAGHHLAINVPQSPIYVDADLTRLAQVFSNLLNNAAKYTERGGEIRLLIEQQNGEVLISVQDNGIGIPQEMLPYVFDMFTPVNRNLQRSQGGLGIGLSIVKKLVEMHGGVVEATSDGDGLGSQFIVRLPVVLSVVQSQTDDDQDIRPSSRRRILVVDDNRDAADSLAKILRLKGNESLSAHDGHEAIRQAAEFRPDVILLDIGMPGLNGYDTARQIRDQPWGKSIFLVALTGWGQDEDRRRSQHAGFDLHVVKPINAATLEKLLASAKAATG
jgi:CheY-like chemotaxis protein